MTTEDLIEQLAGLQTRSAARDLLVQTGASVVDKLLSALAGDLDPEHRKMIMRVLLELNDPHSEEVFRKSLDSDDEDMRAIAATGLYWLGAVDALEACLKTIDDAPDMLHYDTTPSVQALTKIGLPALHSLLPLLDAEDERTRQHAQKVLEQVTFNEIKKALNPPPLSPLATTEWRKVWESNGDYQWNGPAEQRRAAIKRWEQWINSR
jgi:HEAT repeat protein